MIETTCRVCGYDEGDERWTGSDGAQYVICPCCGAESGVEDIRLGWVRDYRSRWMAEGCPWRDRGEQPADWDADQQLRAVPDPWR